MRTTTSFLPPAPRRAGGRPPGPVVPVTVGDAAVRLSSDIGLIVTCAHTPVGISETPRSSGAVDPLVHGQQQMIEFGAQTEAGVLDRADFGYQPLRQQT